MRRIVVATVAACLMGPAVVAHTAFGHAMLDRALPAVGSAVFGAPATVDLMYSKPVDPVFSRIQVTDANSVRVDEGKVTIREGGRILSVGLRPLPPGVYAVKWHVTSVDSHKTEGHFTFTVRP